MGENIKAIRARIRSVDSTRHITKAMELVASSKIRRAGEKTERSRFYREVMISAFAGLKAEKSAYSLPRDEAKPTLYIVVAGDRGLAGGYNSNIFRLVAGILKPGDRILPLGKRAVDYYRSHGEIVSDEFLTVEGFDAARSSAVAYRAKSLYDDGAVGAVVLVSTKFKSMLSQVPEKTPLLPLSEVILPEKAENPEKADGPAALIEYEPSAEAVLDALIPEYLSGVIYTTVCEAFTAELAARRTAMDTATKNADEMLGSLSLTYNRARQSAITQEITEIVAGANA